jgi:hypothetical protein
MSARCARAQRRVFTSPPIKPAPIKIKFTLDEDRNLIELVQRFGSKDWIRISSMMNGRNPRQCRERYNNYLNPDLRTGGWTAQEDELLQKKFEQLGPKWNAIGKCFVNRSDNGLRNRWMVLARQRARGAEGWGSDAVGAIEQQASFETKGEEWSENWAEFAF